MINLVNPIKKFIEIIKMIIMFPIMFVRYRKGMQNAEDAMRRMLRDPRFRKEFLEYQRFMQGKLPPNAEYVDVEYIDDDDYIEFDLDDEIEDDLLEDEDIDDIFT